MGIFFEFLKFSEIFLKKFLKFFEKFFSKKFFSDVSNSTFSDKVLNKYPQQFVQCFIAEQNMVGVAVGMSCRGRTIPHARFIF